MVETSTSTGTLEAMELFVMVSISRGGLNSLYAFQQESGLQPGSLKAVIGHLEKEGLMVRTPGGKRGRRLMVLTATGEDRIEKEWKQSLDPHREMESVLRSATVALLMGDRGAAINYLFQSASERGRRLGAPVFAEIEAEERPMDLHAAMRSVYEQRRRAMEADLLQGFGTMLGETGKRANRNA